MWTLIILLTIFIVAFTPRFLSARNVDMTWDEGLYTLTGMVALRNIVTCNFSSKAWNFELHPPVMMYIYGITYSTYVFVKTALKHGLKLDLNKLAQEGASLFAGRKTLLVIRLPSIILGSVSCVLVYLICLDIFKSALIGIMASLFLALTPIFLTWSSQAMLESGVTFFYLLTIWTFLRAFEYNSLGYAIISGISLGLAFGSKETGFGIPLVVSPWLAFLFLKTYMLNDLNAIVRWCQITFVWLFLGFSTFYLVWPWLWRNPIRQLTKGYRVTSKMTTGKGWGYYLVNLLAATPMTLIFLYCIGVLEAVYLSINQSTLILLLSWIFLPLTLMSTPFIPKRGRTDETTFVLPALSILAALAISRISSIIAEALGIFNDLIMLLLGSIFLCLTLLEILSVHPYYVDYYNHIVRLINKTKTRFPVGWWGEGMGGAMTYIDEHAPLNTTVWIYGPKTTAFYHSKRVNLEKSIGTESIFHARKKAGFDVSIDFSFYKCRQGDLTFYFPYYYPGRHSGFNIDELKAKDVSYIVIYRWAICDPSETGLDHGNREIVKSFQDKYDPVYISKIKDVDVCWVYKVLR